MGKGLVVGKSYEPIPERTEQAAKAVVDAADNAWLWN